MGASLLSAPSGSPWQCPGSARKLDFGVLSGMGTGSGHGSQRAGIGAFCVHWREERRLAWGVVVNH